MIRICVGIFEAALVVKVCNGVSWLRSRYNDNAWPQGGRKENGNWKIIEKI